LFNIWSSNIMLYFLITSVLLKIGSFPCYFWFPAVIASSNWIACLTLTTWQKLAPLIILTLLTENGNFIFFIAAANALIGGALGINQSNLRRIIAYSSINHIGWMIRILIIKSFFYCITYFIMYVILTSPIFLIFYTKSIYNINSFKIRKITQFSVILLLLSLAGLPPLRGFLPKLIVIIVLISHNTILVLILIMGSLLALYFYLSIVINIILSWTIHNTKRKRLLVFRSLFSLIWIPLVILYAMTFFHKSQRYRNALLYSRHLSRNNWRRDKTPYSNWTYTTRVISWKGPAIQYYSNRPCIYHNFLYSYTNIYWRVWKLNTTPYIRSARYGLSTS
jgi:NADH-ubiquinone oxidoreductase chain 2